MAEALFDTSVIIDWLRDRQQAIEEMERYSVHKISRITWIEALAGEPGEARANLIDLLKPFEIIELSVPIASRAADIRYRTRIKLPDAMIWATAQQHDLLLVTRNSKDFPDGTANVRIPYTVQDRA